MEVTFEILNRAKHIQKKSLDKGLVEIDYFFIKLAEMELKIEELESKLDRNLYGED